MRQFCRLVLVLTIAAIGGLGCHSDVSGAFDRAAAVQRIEVRLAAEKAWNEQYGEAARALRKRRKAGEDVTAEMEKLPAYPTFADLNDDALSVIEADPTDAAAFKAINVVLGNSKGLDSPVQRTLHARMARILLDHHLNREDFLSVLNPYAYLSDPVARIAYWEEIYRGSPHPQVRAEAAYQLADQYLVDAGQPGLTPAAREDLRQKVQHYAGILCDDYADVSSRAKEADRFLAALNLALGATLPDINVATIKGGTDALTNYRRKVVLLDFWATWCGACRKDHPKLIALNQELGSQPFQIISVSADENREVVTQYMAKAHLPWPQWYVGPEGPLLKEWGIQGYPTYLLIDRDGKLQARGNPLSLDTIMDQARKLVAGVTPAQAAAH